MNVKEIIALLQEKGYDVTYRKRSDGGYLITSINGEKFSGAKGNTRAREILGAQLSTRRKTQLEYNVRKLITNVKHTKPIDKELDTLLKRIQRKWRKLKVKGKITRKKVKFNIRTIGRDATIRYLERMERYASGFAYEENVRHLIARIQRLTYQFNKSEEIDKITRLIKYIEAIIDSFRDEWIPKVYEVAYKMEQRQINFNDGIRQIKQIIEM